MRLSYISVRPRRHRIRLTAYALFFCAVLLGSICLQLHVKKTAAAEANRMHRAVLAHMNEENDALRRALAEQDAAAVSRHADTLCGYASLFQTLHSTGEEQPLLDALADTAQFYSALSDAAAQTPTDMTTGDSGFWNSAADTVSEHIASMALAMSDRQEPGCPTDAETAAASMLSAFTASFRVDPLRITAVQSAGFRFDHEPMVSQAQARQILLGLIGNTASFLGNTVTDDAHGCYIFSCQNGYAEISRCGGHLLSYAFYPRNTASTDIHLLNDADLAELAAAFLRKNAIPVTSTDTWEDRHGVRIFRAVTKDGDIVTVGIRMHDGAAVYFSAEAYYCNTPEAEP